MNRTWHINKFNLKPKCLWKLIGKKDTKLCVWTVWQRLLFMVSADKLSVMELQCAGYNPSVVLALLRGLVEPCLAPSAAARLRREASMLVPSSDLNN
eukprot:245968-Amphidinium_carterae.1